MDFMLTGFTNPSQLSFILSITIAMRRNVASRGLTAAMISGVAAQNASLASVCTVEYVQSVLPATNFIEGVAVDVNSVTASTVTNYTVTATDGMLGGSGYDFCNVTFSYTHTGLDDTVSFLLYKTNNCLHLPPWFTLLCNIY